MEFDFKSIFMYVSDDNSIILIPTTVNKHNLIAEIDKVTQLQFPYSDETLEEVLLTALDECHTMEPNEDKKSAIERILNIKGYSKAMKHFRLIDFSWQKKHGYKFTPTEKKKNYYSFLPAISLGKTVEKGMLANTFKRALELCR